MAKNKVGILFSGGTESTALIKYYKNKNYSISLLYIFMGYEWEKIEFEHAKNVANFFDLTVKSLDFSNHFNSKSLGKVTNVQENIIILRNLSLLTFSSLYFINNNILKLSFGLQEDFDYPDSNISYIKKVEELIQIGSMKKNFKIEIPFYNTLKKDILKNYNLPLNLIFSCTNPINNNRCNKCFKCKELTNAIKDSK
ncbi:7-cyano-7-deazaguanine synthase [Aliarcobacter butzleri]|uniref:7-cyano-7-deazaguanine synthase n=1 Tax=Aliarcobacter butzleri TaxID=28197 RepID=UPI003AEE9976